MKGRALHTLIMLSCRRSVAIRALPLLGIVLLMLLMVVSGFAQEGYLYPVKAVETGFPYLSPVLDQRIMLINAFGFQMSLFGAINGSGENHVAALNYLAMTATLVGALLVIFNAKYRKASTILPWLLLVIITIFAPYGSKLLFSPTTPSGVQKGFTSTSDMKNSCLTSPTACGFTPQLAGIHIASILQLTLSDLFNSVQWKGLIEGTMASAGLRGTPKLVASPEWLDKISNFRKKCGPQFGWDQIVKNRLVTQPSVYAANTNIPGDTYFMQTFSDEWKGVIDPYFNQQNPTFEMYPPKSIYLYDEHNYPGDKSPSPEIKNMWNDARNKQAYVDGIQALYRAITGSDKSVDFRTTSVSAGTPKPNEDAQAVQEASTNKGEKLSIQEALQEMDASGFFNVTYKGMAWSDSFQGVESGFFFSWAGPKDNQNDNANNTQDSITPSELRGCYNPGGYEEFGFNFSSDCTLREKFSVKWQAGSIQSFLNGTQGDGSRLSLLAAALKNPDSPIYKMPVGTVSYGMQNPVSTEKAKASEPQAAMSCYREGNNLIDQALNWTLGLAGKAKGLQPLNTLLVTQRAVPAKTDDEHVTLKLEQLVSTDHLEMGGALDGAEVVYNPIGTNIILAYDRNETNEKNNSRRDDKQLGDASRYDILLRTILDGIEQSTALNSNTKAEQKSTSDKTEVALVGNDTLTSVGGSVATFLADKILEIGAWITGPLSKAIVFFLSVLVDMALMCLIILTPIMFLIGLAMPGSALGLLTIAIMGAFILKTVPITLLILNNVGGMISLMINQGGGANKDAMDNLLILAMGGLYANLVGMTFFLLFKLGDPATVLSKFTALDGSAKQIADKGMAATIALASAAGLAIGGAVGGGGSALFAAGRRLGIPTDAMNAAKNIATGGADGMKEETTGKETTNPSIDDDKGTLPEVFDSQGNPITDPDALARLKDPDTQDLIASMKGSGEFDGKEGHINELAAFDSTTMPDGRVFKRINKYNDDGGDDGAPDSTPPAPTVPPAPPAPPAVPAATQNRLNNAVDPNAASQALIPEDASGGSGGGSGRGVSDGVQSVRVVGSDVPLVAQVPPDAAGSDSVTGGSVDPINKVQEIANQKAAEREGDEVASMRTAIANLRNNPDIKNKPGVNEILDEAEGMLRTVGNEGVDGAGVLADVQKKYNQAMLTGSMSPEKLKENAQLRTNLAHQNAALLSEHDKKYGDKYAEIESRINNKTASKEDKAIIDRRDELRKFDPVAVIEGELATRLAQLQKLGASGKADKTPGVLQSMLSGFYGGISGGAGGLSKIPVIGSAITESLNEFYQAPERARAWNTSGGMRKWWTAQGDAQRMGFYQKEMAPIGAATQYQSMLQVGGFEGQASLVRQAANEAVAKTQSQFNAMMASQRDILTGKFEDANAGKGWSSDTMQENLAKHLEKSFASANFQANMDIKDLAGLGAIEAADRISSVRQEAFIMQGDSLLVKKANLGKDMLLNSAVDKGDGLGSVTDVEVKDVKVKLTADVLNKFRGDLASKKVSGNIDDMMIAHYGLAEKQYLRGDVDWNATRSMTRNSAAAATFARQDVSTDYLIGGHIKMVEGKIKFKESQGQYQTLVRFRHEENGKKNEEIEQVIIDSGGYEKALEKAGFDKARQKYEKANNGVKLSGAAMKTLERATLDSYAKAELQRRGETLPLEAVFDEAGMNGLMKYIEKSAMASINQGVQSVKIENNLAKGVLGNLVRNGNISKQADVSPYVSALKGNARVRMPDVKKTIEDFIGTLIQDDFEQAGRINSILDKHLKISMIEIKEPDEEGYAFGISEAQFKAMKNELGGKFADRLEKNFLDSSSVGSNGNRFITKVVGKGSRVIVNDDKKK